MKLTFEMGRRNVDGEGVLPIAQLPMSALIIGDFGAGAVAPATLQSAADLGPLLEKWAPELRLDLQNLLADGPLQVRYKVQSLKDFAPQRLVRAEPRLARMAALIVALYEVERAADPRAEVEKLAREHADLTAVAPLLAACAQAAKDDAAPDASASARAPAKQAASPAPAAARRDEALGPDGLLSLVDVPGEAEQRQARARSAISSVVGAIAKGRNKPSKRGALRERIGEVVTLFSRQVDQILHHEELQRVEAMWRGLKLLVERTDFRKGARLDVVQSTRAALEETVAACAEALLAEDGLPVTFVLAPYLFSDPQQDGPTLAALAEQGERMQAPVITSLGGGFFGLKEGERASTLAYPTTLLQQPQYEPWRALMAAERGRWLLAVFNRVLLRAPYEVAVEGQLLYEEGIRAERDRLWGDAGWAVASLICRSFGRYGWPTEIVGPRDGRVDDLAVRPYLRESGRRVDFSFEDRLTSELIDELQRCGVAVFVAADNSDSAVLSAAPAVHGELGARHHPFTYQLVVARLAQIVAAFRRAAAGVAPQELAQGLEKVLWQVIADTGMGARCEVAVGEADGAPLVEIYVRTGRGVLHGAEVGFSFALGAR